MTRNLPDRIRVIIEKAYSNPNTQQILEELNLDRAGFTKAIQQYKSNYWLTEILGVDLNEEGYRKARRLKQVFEELNVSRKKVKGPKKKKSTWRVVPKLDLEIRFNALQKFRTRTQAVRDSQILEANEFEYFVRDSAYRTLVKGSGHCAANQEDVDAALQLHQQREIIIEQIVDRLYEQCTHDSQIVPQLTYAKESDQFTITIDDSSFSFNVSDRFSLSELTGYLKIDKNKVSRLILCSGLDHEGYLVPVGTEEPNEQDYSMDLSDEQRAELEQEVDFVDFDFDRFEVDFEQAQQQAPTSYQLKIETCAFSAIYVVFHPYLNSNQENMPKVNALLGITDKTRPQLEEVDLLNSHHFMELATRITPLYNHVMMRLYERLQEQ